MVEGPKHWISPMTPSIKFTFFFVEAQIITLDIMAILEMSLKHLNSEDSKNEKEEE